VVYRRKKKEIVYLFFEFVRERSVCECMDV